MSPEVTKAKEAAAAATGDARAAAYGAWQKAANANPSVFLPIPNRYYEAVRGWSSSVLPGIAADNKIHPITDKVRQMDHHGNFTAAVTQFPPGN